MRGFFAPPARTQAKIPNVAASSGGVVNGELFSTDFSTGTLDTIFDFWWQNTGTLTIVNDAGAYAGKAMRASWNAIGPTDGDIGARKNMPGTALHKLFVRIQLKLSSSTDLVNGIQKLIRVRGIQNGVADQVLGTADGQWGLFDFYPEITGGAKYDQTVAHPNLSDVVGSYHWVEFMVDYSTLTSLTGRIWVDGTLLVDQTVAVTGLTTLHLEKILFFSILNQSIGAPKSDYIGKIDCSASLLGVP